MATRNHNVDLTKYEDSINALVEESNKEWASYCTQEGLMDEKIDDSMKISVDITKEGEG